MIPKFTLITIEALDIMNYYVKNDLQITLEYQKEIHFELTQKYIHLIYSKELITIEIFFFQYSKALLTAFVKKHMGSL